MLRPLRLLMGAALLLSFAHCKRQPTAAAGGTIVLSIDSSRPIDRIALKAIDKDGNSAEFSFETGGRDLTKEPATGEVVPGPSIKTGPVSFIGFGFAQTSVTAVVSGRADAEFLAGQRTNVRLSLQGDRIDVDQDGHIKQEDCNDNNSAQNPFLAEKCNNNIDDNCDGSVDERCPDCTPGQTRNCYTALDQASRSIGECRDGVQSCVNGAWSTCAGSVTPNVQLCNGKDENCDRSIDEGCPCLAGSQRFCFGKQVTTPGAAATTLTNVFGECVAGTQRCIGTSWGKCEGATYAVTETCDGKDNDCDGVFDNGFDVDGDDFTTCGTYTTKNGVTCTHTNNGGTSPTMIDCDDGNAARHPCKVETCGDGNVDDNCDGAANECQMATGNCGPQGFVAGYVTDTAGRLMAECRSLDLNYGTQCDTATAQCKTADAQCTGVTGPPGTNVVGTRPTCFEPGGCVAGQKSAPTTGSPVVTGDPYNDCGGVACDAGTRVFANFATTGGNFFEAGTGWFRNAGMSRYECRAMPDVAANETECNGSGSCKGASPVGIITECRGDDPAATISTAVGTVLSGVSGAVVPTGCKVPLAGSCKTTAGGTVTLPGVANVPDGNPDPLSRCSGSSAACDGAVTHTWGGADNDCSWVTTPPPAINNCVGGNCDMTISVAICAPSGPTGVQTTTYTALDPSCRIIGACNATITDVVTPSTDLTFNANGGVRAGTGAAGPPGCQGVGTTCYDSGQGGGQANPSCGQCDRAAYACGRNCITCNGAADCRRGYQANGNFDAVSAGQGTAHDCLCPISGLPGNLTAGFACNGTCCAANRACIDGVCQGSAPSGSLIACGNGGTGSEANATCDGRTEICNVDIVNPTINGGETARAPFKCQPASGNAACNQRICAAGQYCSNVTNSICQDCQTNGDIPCNHNCCDPASAEACTSFTNSTCSTCGSVQQACGTACCTGTDRCGAAPNCVTCMNHAACGLSGSACTFPAKCYATAATGACASYNCTDVPNCGSTTNCGNGFSGDTACGALQKCWGNIASPDSCDDYSCQACNLDNHCGPGNGADSCTFPAKCYANSSPGACASYNCTNVTNCATTANCGDGHSGDTACSGGALGKCWSNIATADSCDDLSCQMCNTNLHCGAGNGTSDVCPSTSNGTTRCNAFQNAGAACADWRCDSCSGDNGNTTFCGTTGAVCPIANHVCQTAVTTTKAQFNATHANALCADYSCQLKTTTGAAGAPGVHLGPGNAPQATCCGRNCVVCPVSCNSNGTAGDFSDDFCN